MNFTLSGISPEQADHYIAASSFVNTFPKILFGPPLGDSVLPSPRIIDSFLALSSFHSKYLSNSSFAKRSIHPA